MWKKTYNMYVLIIKRKPEIFWKLTKICSFFLIKKKWHIATSIFHLIFLLLNIGYK